MKKQLKGKQSFYDDKQRENVVSYYLMEDQEHTMYGVELEKYQEETNVIEWDAVPSISESMELVDRVIHNLIKYKVTPISLAESLDEIMTREEEDGRSKYKILYKEGEAEISEKKSRFIAHIAPAQTEEEAQAFIEKIKNNTGMQGITAGHTVSEKSNQPCVVVMMGNQVELLGSQCLRC